jgi:signal transduction histidine kinase
VEFAVAPYFYQTRWFLPLSAGLAALVGWLAFRLRVLQVRSRLDAVLAERSRIARELHDTLIQGFSGVTMQMQGLAARLRPSIDRAQLEEIIDDAGRCLRDARRSVGGLRTGAKTGAGLAESVAQAARQLTETHDVNLVLHLTQTHWNLPADAEYHVLRIAQEAIANAVKHSGGRTIEVAMTGTSRELRLAIRDDGAGFAIDSDEHLLAGHYGLIGMRERASQIGGVIDFDSQPGQGTTVRLRLSLNGATGAGPSAGAVSGQSSHPNAS